MNWRTENALTMICMLILVLGLYSMSHSWHALWGMLLMLNINYPKS